MSNLLDIFPDEKNLEEQPRPYYNHAVAFKEVVTRKERWEQLQQAGLNVFFFPSKYVTGCDLLSDSGTTTMTNLQWASLHEGDESYGSNKGYFKLQKQINETFGEGFFSDSRTAASNAFLFHQGRAAENALFSLLAKQGKDFIIPSNGHFDTTEANIQANGMQALNLFSDALKNPEAETCFKGDMNVEKFKKVLEESKERIPLAFLTVTNNTGGGEPVCMENIREVSQLAHEHEIPLFFDACRFAENAWFIQQNEKGYREKSIQEIVHEMFTHVDGFTISFKKDGLANMGGGLFLKENGLFVKKFPAIADAILNHQILKEGHPTYGGMSGRDIMALAQGLNFVTHEEYLTQRIQQVQQFGLAMEKAGLPVLTPIGGHAVYLDMTKFFERTALQPDDFPGVSFTALLLGLYGHRAVELGNFAFGHYDKETGKNVFPEVNFVRFAVPRLRYEQKDLDSVVHAVKALYDNRDSIPGVEVIHGKELPLRHFKAKFKFKE